MNKHEEREPERYARICNRLSKLADITSRCEFLNDDGKYLIISALEQVEPTRMRDDGTCEVCGEDLHPWDKFCPECGSPIMGHGSDWV